MSDLTIRPATAADLDVLGSTLGNTHLYRDRLARQARHRGLLLLAGMAGDPAPVGVVYLWLERAEEHELRTLLPRVPLLMNLLVRTDMRNRGIGTGLVRHAERELVARGYPRVALGVEPRNRNAIRLYERLGYQDWGKGDVDTRYSGTHACGGFLVSYPERCVIYVRHLAEDVPSLDAYVCTEAARY